MPPDWRSPSTRSSPVFLCSTYGQADLPADALDAAAAYIPKEDLSAQVLRDLWDEAQVP